MEWTNIAEGQWAADASDLACWCEQLRVATPPCPKCGRSLPTPASGWEKRTDNEGDVIAWYLTHGCGARLRIYND